MSDPTAETPMPTRENGEIDAPAATPIEARSPLSPPYRWLSIGMFALIFLAAFEAMAVTTIMPLVASDLHGEALYALAFAVPLAAGIIGMVIAGNWTDRSGPLPSLVTAAGLFVVGLVIAGTATDMNVLIVGRFVHGLSGAAVIVPLYVIVARVYPEALRARVFAGFAAAWVIPSMVGPAVAGVIAETWSWHWVFLGVIGLLVPAAAMILPPILRVRGEIAGDPSVSWSLGRVGWAVLTAVGALGISLAKEFSDPWRWIVAAVAIVLVVVAVRPLLPAGAVRAARGLPATVLSRFVVAGAFFGSEIYLPYLLMEDYEFSASAAGAVLTGAGISWAAASWLQGRLGDRVSNARAVLIGSGLLVVALAVVLAVAAFHLPPAVAFVAWTLAGGAMGFMYPRHSVSVLGMSKVSEQGFNSAALSIAESLGASVALAVTALVSSAVVVGGFSADFAVTLVIAVVALLLAPRVRPEASGAS
ncbi:MFS transporter [Agromyces sp. S2-1-8]|uniref:MFS transporter n=1 Tax=Agromyces sp. S2-1-8 TaxID=2897180 RepID=UPI001E4C7E6A|nr:MFS transporter [Agromyces sp. S2-1-8]MCD5348238.1 MFS transporter [Agromyces sp. S2-1-8]